MKWIAETPTKSSKRYWYRGAPGQSPVPFLFQDGRFYSASGIWFFPSDFPGDFIDDLPGEWAADEELSDGTK